MRIGIYIGINTPGTPGVVAPTFLVSEELLLNLQTEGGDFIIAEQSN